MLLENKDNVNKSKLYSIFGLNVSNNFNLPLLPPQPQQAAPQEKPKKIRMTGVDKMKIGQSYGNFSQIGGKV